MIRYTSLCLIPLVLAPAVASAQQPDEKVRKSYEDIEIMRSLLLDKIQTSINQCSKCHANPFAHTATDPWTRESLGEDLLVGRSRAGASGIGAEGAYVKGHGVIFQVHMPPVMSILSPSNSPKIEKPLTEWERMKQKMRGEKSAADRGRDFDFHHRGIADILLQTLGENGHNFAQLADDERLTLIVTLRAGGDAPVSGIEKKVSASKKASESMTALALLALKESGVEPATAVRDQMLLGDLHAKHGRYKEALSAYEKALKQNPSPQQKAELYQKLAQSILAQESGAHAQAIAKAIQFLKKAQADLDKKGVEAPSAPRPMQDRLQMSATKKVLDQFAAGKLTYAELRAHAQVEWLQLSRIEAKTKK